MLWVGLILLTACEQKSAISGLWIVKTVKVGGQELTPNARWTRFNPDSTQESGNGWVQHSTGTWSFNKKSNKLSITNANGLTDPYEAFKVRLNNDTMYWQRIEDGQNVLITLEKSDHLPETYGDQLLGLWKLQKAIGNGRYFHVSDSIKPEDYLFFRWDRRFVMNCDLGRINGVYNVNGHRPELELIPYSDSLNRDFWAISFDKNTIELKLLNTDSPVTRKFIRIHQFPE